MARLYRKKPITIEAVQYTRDSAIEAIEFLREGKVHFLLKNAGIVIRTLEGDMLAEEGDYLIRGIQDEYYPCKPAIFEATYEAIGQS